MATRKFSWSKEAMLLFVALMLFVGCAGNTESAFQRDQREQQQVQQEMMNEGFVDKVESFDLPTDPRQQLCQEGGLQMIKVGVDPIAPYQYDPQTEDLYKIKVPTYVRTRGKRSKKEIAGCLPVGTVLVTKKDQYKAERILECGNPVFNDVYVNRTNVTKKEEKKVAAAIVSKKKKDCWGKGTAAAGAGSALMTFGAVNFSNPAGWFSLAVGIPLEIYSIFEDGSDGRCKAAAGVMGGVGGLFGGSAYRNAQADHSSNTSSSGSGSDDHEGPAMPPPVP